MTGADLLRQAAARAPAGSLGEAVAAWLRNHAGSGVIQPEALAVARAILNEDPAGNALRDAADALDKNPERRWSAGVVAFWLRDRADRADHA